MNRWGSLLIASRIIRLLPVWVNRAWEHFFVGLVKTTENFGTGGAGSSGITGLVGVSL